MIKMLQILPITIAVLGLATGSPYAQDVAAGQMARPALQIPSALRNEHEQLHAKLAAAISAGGRTGEAATEVEKLLEPHFKKEEQYAMPLLGLLPSVAAGKMPTESKNVIALSERLKSEMPGMLREHAAIAAAVQRLRAAALLERQSAAAQFAEALMAHAQQEEQIHYPSAVLVGEFIKSRR